MPIRCTPAKCTPVRCMTAGYTPIRCTSIKCTPIRFVSIHFIGVRLKRAPYRHASLIAEIINSRNYLPRKLPHKSTLGICEKAAENGVLSTTPQTREPRRFKLVLGFCAKLGRF
jgi:hypothetical protein